MMRLRLAVRENVLSDPSAITAPMVLDAIEGSGRGWVHEAGEEMTGFSIARSTDRCLWALFVRPGRERRGIGRALHDAAVEWLFSLNDGPIWLETDAATRAERFYRGSGWRVSERRADGVLRLELAKRDFTAGLSRRPSDP